MSQITDSSLYIHLLDLPKTNDLLTQDLKTLEALFNEKQISVEEYIQRSSLVYQVSQIQTLYHH